MISSTETSCPGICVPLEPRNPLKPEGPLLLPVQAEQGDDGVQAGGRPHRWPNTPNEAALSPQLPPSAA